ncbi:globin, partial [Klebsiella pneumoniae]|nr:globin [Klebsiella pneumoniae]
KFYRDLFEASLNRVVPERDKQRFFQAFYSTFIHMSPETEQHFSQRSGEAGQQMIFKSFFAMLAVNGDLFVPDFLERLARAQSE